MHEEAQEPGEIVGIARRRTARSASIDYSERIPNNVGLARDRRLQRALERWQPQFLDWWRQLGPVAPPARRLPAHRDRGRPGRLGPLRLREDAGLPVGHLPGRARPGPHDRLRRAPGRAGLAGGAGRVPRRPAPADRRPGRHRAGLGRAAAPPRRHRAEPVRPAQPVPGQRRGGPPPVGDGLPAARLLRPGRPRRGRPAARAALRRRRQPAHPRRVQRADHRLAVVLHVHLLHRPGRQVPARHRWRRAASTRWPGPASSCSRKKRTTCSSARRRAAGGAAHRGADGRARHR